MSIEFIVSFRASLTILALFVIAIDFYYSYKSFQQTEEIGKYLGFATLAAGLVTLSYLISVRTHSYFVRSMTSSLYFLGIDWMLVFLVIFTYYFTGRHKTKESRCMKRVIIAIAAFDSIVMLVNIFKEIAVSYVYRDTIIAKFSYDMKPLYIFHLVFTYLLVGFVIYILGVKISQTPRQYQKQYWLIIASIAMVIIVNAIFLYPVTYELYGLLDYSLIFYSIAIFIIYWAAFEFRKKEMLETLSMTIFQNIDQGIVLFDHEEELIMKNQKAERLFPNIKWENKMRAREFAKKIGIWEEPPDEDRYSMQCYKDGTSEPLRCDYDRLRDYRNMMTGNLLVFTEPDNSIDLLTGFQSWEFFHRTLAENPYDFDHPTAVAVFDIVGLGEVNRTFGREVGDQRIRNLVQVMRRTMPKGTFFVRGYEANLIAICAQATEEDIVKKVEAVRKACGDSVLYGLSSTLDSSVPDTSTLAKRESVEDGRNILQAITTAMRALEVKNLLHAGTIHSQTLASLVRALQESDTDTEEHVKRTQKMGAALGIRIGLSDAQQADLSLLCLLHDIGKIGIPLEILNKPGKLTPAEWNVLKTHAEKGYEIAMSNDELKSAANLILHHHERWDGNGYPERLSGHNIPLLSRIISVVDSYDAMVNNRSYRKGLSPEKAQEEIRKNAGKQFDPDIAEEFLTMLKENPGITAGEKTGGPEIRVFRQVGPSAASDTIAAFKRKDSSGASTGEAYTVTVTGSTAKKSTRAIPYSRYILDLDDHIVETDMMFSEITGYSSEEVIGRLSQYDLIAAEDKSFYMTQVNNQFANGSIAYLEHDIMRKDGEKVRIHCIGKRYYDSAAKAYRSEILISRA